MAIPQYLLPKIERDIANLNRWEKTIYSDVQNTALIPVDSTSAWYYAEADREYKQGITEFQAKFEQIVAADPVQSGDAFQQLVDSANHAITGTHSTVQFMKSHSDFLTEYSPYRPLGQSIVPKAEFDQFENAFTTLNNDVGNYYYYKTHSQSSDSDYLF